jgi:hypothetical protein
MSAGDPTVADPSIVAVRMTRMNLQSGGGTHGLLSLFGGAARVSLHVRLATTTQSLSSNCSGVFGVDNGGNADGVYPPAGVQPGDDPVVPISFDAQFRVSPAIDADGKLRFGVLTLPPGATQPSTFALISTCVQESSTASDPCTVVRFPARLMMAQLNAEILLGDQGP